MTDQPSKTATLSETEAAAMPSPLRTLIIAGGALLMFGGVVFLLDRLGGSDVVRTVAPAELPVIAQVPEFSLTERSGRVVSRADLLGEVWVADFIFTRCAGPCPRLSEKFRAMQRDLEGTGGVKLVSICLDPRNDTPRALMNYARRFHADGDRWWFLTGESEKEVHELVSKGFLQSVVAASGNEPLMHSTYMVVIDRRGRIRSAYDGLLTSTRERIMADIAALLGDQTS